VFCFSVKVKHSVFIVKVKLTVPLLCVCVHSAWNGHAWNEWPILCQAGC